MINSAAIKTSKPRTTSGWTPERRERQSAMMKARKIWEKSTGPKTPAGKKRSAANAYKHGLYDATTRSLRTFLILNGRFLTALNRDISKVQKLQRLEKMRPHMGDAKKIAKLENELLKAPPIRHCEERSDEAIQTMLPQTPRLWIAASASPPRNDGFLGKPNTQYRNFPIRVIPAACRRLA